MGGLWSSGLIFVDPFCEILLVVRSLKLKYYIQTKILLCSWVLRVGSSRLRLGRERSACCSDQAWELSVKTQI